MNQKNLVSQFNSIVGDQLITRMNQKKNVLVAFDHFSRWTLAMSCGNNRLDKILKYFTMYIVIHGVPRRTHIDRRTKFMSIDSKAFCNTEAIETIKLPVNDHSATGCVDRTLGS